MTADMRLENGRLLTPEGLSTYGMGIAVRDEVIIARGKTDTLPEARSVIDVEGNVIAPGIVDEHVHDRSLGQTHKEDWETLTSAAAAGGVTTVLGHGNTDPFVEHPRHVKQKLRLANRDAIVDFGCFAWVTPDNYDSLRGLRDAGAVGFQASLAERALDEGQILAVMDQLSSWGERLGLHIEDGRIINERQARLQAAGNEAPIDHCNSRPVVAECTGAATVVELAHETNCPVHIFQVSTGSALAILASAKQSDLDMTIETTPHYLWFTDEVMSQLGSVAVVSPPLRSETERNALRVCGIDNDVIDCLGTDHAPHTEAEKRVQDPFGSVWEVAHGFVGLESAVPALLTLVNNGLLTYPEWIELASANPARTWNLYPQKGSLQVGTDADITVLDINIENTFDRQSLHSKNTVTPFDGITFTGQVLSTIVRGEFVYRKDEIVAPSGFGSQVQT